MVERQKVIVDAYFEPEPNRVIIPLNLLPEWLEDWIGQGEDVKVIQQFDEGAKHLYIEVKNATKRIL